MKEVLALCMQVRNKVITIEKAQSEAKKLVNAK
jgi:hypothetical protein